MEPHYTDYSSCVRIILNITKFLVIFIVLFGVRVNYRLNGMYHVNLRSTGVKLCKENPDAVLYKHGRYGGREFSAELANEIATCPNEICKEFLQDFNCGHFALSMFVHTTTIKDYSCDDGSLLYDEVKKKEPIIGSPIFIEKINNEPKRLNNTNIMCVVRVVQEIDVGNKHYFNLEMRENGLYLHNSWKTTFTYDWFSGLKKEDPFLKRKTIPTQKMHQQFRNECGNGKLLANSQQALDCFTLIKFKPHTFNFFCAPLNTKFKNLI